MSTINTSALLESGSVLPYDQQEIESVMRKILYENGISDVLYEGSNISQLTTVISYVIGSLNVNTAVNIQETLLPLATKRMNILFGARQLGYEPHAKNGYKYKLTLTPKIDESKVDGNGDIDYQDPTKRPIRLVQNTVFQSGEITYYYKGPTIEEFFNFSNFDIQYKNDPTVSAGKEFYKDIDVVEGTLTKWENDPTLHFVVKDYPNEDGIQIPKQDYLIPYHNVEDNGIQVFIESIDYTTAPVNGVRPTVLIERTKSDTFLIDDSFTQDENKFVRLENIILQYPVVFFEYSGMGTPLNTGDNVLVNVFQTLGAGGAADKPMFVQDSTASQLFSVTNQELISRGTSDESSRSVKQNASAFNNTANRAVTKLDYISIMQRHQLIKDADAWGGEDESYANACYVDEITTPDEDPTLPYLGYVWTSTSPYPVRDYSYTARVDYDAGPPVINEVLEKYELEIGTPALSEDNFYNWYQSFEDLYGVHDPATPESNYDGVMDYLEFYKIITMQLQHRHPLYINFDYTCDIVKYDLMKSREEVNTSIFEGIRNYFISTMEFYDVDYLNSNLQRVLDTILSYRSGIGYTLKTSGVLFKNMKDNLTGKTHITLDYPYETMFDKDGFIIAGDVATGEENLCPQIDTIDFGYTGQANPGTGVDLKVDFTPINGIFEVSGDKSEPCDINYGAQSLGTYVVNNTDSVIEIEFDLRPFVGFEDIIFGSLLDPVDPTDSTSPKIGPEGLYAEFDLKYPYTSDGNNNIPFTRNTIPRLRQVEFLYN